MGRGSAGSGAGSSGDGGSWDLRGREGSRGHWQGRRCAGTGGTGRGDRERAGSRRARGGRRRAVVQPCSLWSTTRTAHASTHFFSRLAWVGCLLLFAATLTLAMDDDDADPLRLELATLRQTAARFQASVRRSHRGSLAHLEYSTRRTQQPSSCSATPSTRRVSTTTPPPSNRRTPASPTSSTSSARTQTHQPTLP